MGNTKFHFIRILECWLKVCGLRSRSYGVFTLLIDPQPEFHDFTIFQPISQRQHQIATAQEPRRGRDCGIFVPLQMQRRMKQKKDSSTKSAVETQVFGLVVTSEVQTQEKETGRWLAFSIRTDVPLLFPSQGAVEVEEPVPTQEIFRPLLPLYSPNKHLRL